MANVLGTLLITLEAQTTAFAKGMTDAKNLAFSTSGDIVTSLKSIGEQMGKLRFDSSGEFRKSIGIAGGLFAGIAVGIAAASVEVARETAAQVKSMEKLSQSYGLPIETISQLRVASKLTGVEMDVLTAGLGRMAKAAAMAAEGSKQQSAAFKSLGVQVADSQGHLRPMNDLLPQIAERFSKLQDGTGKTALAMQLFGRSGAQLIPFLNQGASGIKQMQELSDQLGLTWRKEDAEAAAVFQERLEIMELKGTALKEQLARGLMPALDQLATAFVQTSGTGRSAAQVLGETVGTALKYLTVGVASLVADWKQLLIILDLRKWGKEAQQAFDDANASYRRFAEAVLYGKPLPPILKPGGPTGSNPEFQKTGGAAKNSDFSQIVNEATAILDKGNSLQQQIDRIVELQAKIAAFRNSHPEGVFVSLNEAAGKLAEKLKSLVAEQQNWQKSLAIGVVPGGETQNALQKQILGALSLPQVPPVVSGQVQAHADMLRGIEDENQANEERKRIYEESLNPAERYAEIVAKLNQLYSDHSSEEYNRALEDAKEKVLGVFDATQKYRKELESIEALHSQGVLNGPAYGAAKQQATDKLQGAQDQQTLATGGPLAGLHVALQQSMRDWKSWAQNAHDATQYAFAGIESSMARAFSDMALGTKTVGQAFLEMGRGMLTSIVEATSQMVARWITTHVIMAGISKLFGATSAVSESLTGATANAALAESAAFLGAANAYAFWAWNPPVAAAMAAAALAAGSGFAASALSAGVAGAAATSAAGGMELDRDQWVYAHQGEKVLPAKISQGFNRIIDGMSPQVGRGHMAYAGAPGSGSVANSYGGHNFHFNINGSGDPKAVGDAVMGRVQKFFKTGGVMRG